MPKYHLFLKLSHGLLGLKMYLYASETYKILITIHKKGLYMQGL